MAPRHHPPMPGPPPAPPHRRSPRRPASLARTAHFLPILLLTPTACTEPPPPEVDLDPVQAEVFRTTTDTATPVPAPTESPVTLRTAARPSLDPAQQPPTPNDTLAARLAEIAATQQLILARLDSLRQATASPGGPSLAAPLQAPGDPAPASPSPATPLQTPGESATTTQQPPDTATGLELPDLDEATEDVQSIGLGIALSLLVILVFHFLIRAVIWVLETLAERSTARRLSFKWLIPITRMVFWAIAVFLIVNNIFQVDAQGIIAAGAALGVGIAVAAQDVLKNVLGGLTVVFDQPFQVGDKISVGGTYGEVVSIGLRSTRIVTADDDLVSIPNSKLVEEQVANSNAGQLNCQVATSLYLPGRVDERRAKEIAFEAAVTSKYVFLNKPIVVLVTDDFRTTFVTRIKVRAYVLDPRFEFVFQSDVTERARDGFRKAGLMPERDWYPMVEGEGVDGPAEEGAL
ncbi:MAG: mechanosensitive ion channel [Gemmatimonadota bacterium]|nr:mechanosensitive ion channel [Gemmatimonadota bacterium]